MFPRPRSYIPPLEGIPTVKGFHNSEKSNSTLDSLHNVTTLSNGVRVASLDSPGQLAAVGVLVDAGYQRETRENLGVSLLLERLAFKATERTSSEMMLEILDSIGKTVSCNASRESLLYSAIILRHNVPQLVKLLSEVVLEPSLAPEDLEMQKEGIQFDIKNFCSKPESYVQELFHSAAYGPDSPMARSMIVPPEAVDALSPESVRNYLHKNFSPERLIIAGAGIEHDLLVRYVTQYFGHLRPSSSTSKPAPAPVYLGTEIRHHVPEGQFVHMAVGFDSFKASEDEIYPLAILNMLLGGGGSFSAGGPGKGLYSRLYREVLNQYSWVDSAESFFHVYSHCGLFGISASCYPDQALKLAELLASQFITLATTAVSEEELSRARNQLRSSLLFNLETRFLQYEDTARQVHMSGVPKSPSQMCDSIAKVSAEDIQRIARKMLSSKPSLVLVGPQEALPQSIYSVFANVGRFGAEPTAFNTYSSYSSDGDLNRWDWMLTKRTVTPLQQKQEDSSRNWLRVFKK